MNMNEQQNARGKSGQLQSAEPMLLKKLLRLALEGDTEAVETILSRVSYTQFENPEIASVFRAASDLNKAGRLINISELQCQLLDYPENGRMSEQTLTDFTRDATVNMISSVGYASDIYNVVQNWKRRQVDEIFYKQCKGGINQKIEEIHSCMETLMNADTTEKGDKWLAQVVEEQSSKRFTEEHVTKRFKFNFGCIDRVIDGLEPGDIMVIAARPSVGKTALALNLALGACQNGPVYFVSLEMSDSQLYDRVIAGESKIPMRTIRSATEFESENQKRDFDLANERLKGKQLILAMPEAGINTVSKIRRHAKKIKNLQMIFIDYIQLMHSDSGKTMDEYALTTENSKLLKSLAMELGVAIVVLCQLNRAVEARSEKKPVMSDLRGSGQIEQDASTILLLYNTDIEDEDCANRIAAGSDEKQTHIKAAEIAKNRQGSQAEIKLKFNGPLQKMYEYMEYNGRQADESNPYGYKKNPNAVQPTYHKDDFIPVNMEYDPNDPFS